MRDDDKLLCYCKGVTHGRVRVAIREGKLRTVEQVMRECDAGTGCRSCHPDIEDLIVEERRRSDGSPRGIVAVLRRIFARR